MKTKENIIRLNPNLDIIKRNITDKNKDIDQKLKMKNTINNIIASIIKSNNAQ